MIHTDHKSLEQISMKNLVDAPVYLQRILLKLQDYDFTIKYFSGQEMVAAYTLSIYSPEDAPDILIGISIMDQDQKVCSHLMTTMCSFCHHVQTITLVIMQTISDAMLTM